MPEDNPPGQQRRLLRAMDTNPILCERCNVAFWDVRQPGMHQPSPSTKAAEVWRLGGCKASTSELCDGAVALIAIYHGKRFASKVRKAMLDQFGKPQ